MSGDATAREDDSAEGRAPPAAHASLAPSRNALRLMGWAFAAMYAVMSAIHVADLQAPGAIQGLASSLVTMIAFLVALAAIRRKTPSSRVANHITGVSALVVLANICLHYAFARDPSVVAMFVFFAVGAGGLLLHRRWLLVSLATSFVAWMALSVWVLPHPNVVRDGFALVTVLGIGFAVHALRVRGLRQIEALRDAADRRKRLAETRLAKLERTQESLVRLVERNPDGMVVFRDGRILFVNRRFADTLRYEDCAALVGAKLTDILELGEERTLFASDASTVVREVKARRRTGESVMLEVASTPIEWQDERATLLSARDVTERHALLHDRVMNADRMMSIGRLAAGVAHEINNPVTYVLSNLAELASDPARLDAPAMLAEAREGAERIRAIVHTLKTFTRPESVALRRVDIVDLLESSLRMVRNELRHTTTKIERCFRSRPVSMTDPNRLGQVFVNLLLNASQAMEGRRSTTLTLTVDEHDGHARVAISDTGTGMTPEVQRRLYEPFFTTKAAGQGIGLGLHYCRSAVEDLGGVITVATEVGVGSTFVVRLPAAVGSIASQEADPLSADSPGAAARVLVLDDEPAVARAAARALRSHDVKIAESPAAGIEQFLGGQFDALVCDLMMPDMDGVEVHRRVADAGLGLEDRIVFITGGVLTPKVQEFLDGRPDRVVHKPFDTAALRDAVASVLRAHPRPSTRAPAPP